MSGATSWSAEAGSPDGGGDENSVSPDRNPTGAIGLAATTFATLSITSFAVASRGRARTAAVRARPRSDHDALCRVKEVLLSGMAGASESTLDRVGMRGERRA